MRKKRKLKALKISDVVIYIIVFAVGFTMFYPLYNCVLVSISPQYVAIRTPFMLIPTKFDFSAYQYAFKSTNVLYGVGVSALKVIGAGALSMFMNITTAYALTKPIPGKKFLYVFVFIPMYFSGGMIPSYLLIKDLGLIDSIWALILPVGISTATILIFMRYFNALPLELEESARIDGANDVVILLKIVGPLMKPIFATYFLYGAVDNWNSWLDGLLYIQTARKMPIQSILREIINNATFSELTLETGRKITVYSESIKMACLVVGMVPIMIFYPLLQKHFVSGITAGAVKG